jgi:hypothetical protein
MLWAGVEPTPQVTATVRTTAKFRSVVRYENSQQFIHKVTAITGYAYV